MFKRALKFVAAAAMLLAPTLTTVITASPAHAAGSAVDSGSVLGESSFDIFHDASSDPSCLIFWDNFYAVTVTPGVDPSTTFNGTNDYHYGPGKPVTLHFAWDTSQGCAGYAATSATVVLRYAAGGQVGSTSWPVTISGWTGNVSTTMYFDSNAFSGSRTGATAQIGQFYVGLTLSGGDEAGASTEGVVPAGNAYDTPQSYYTKGMFSTGYMASLYDSRTKSAGFDTDASHLGKGLSLNRIYQSNWALPSSSVSTYAQAKVGVVWSEKICPGANQGCTYPDPNFTQTSGKSIWKTIADGDQDSGTNGLIAQIQSLASTASTNQVPIGVALYHEPKSKVNACSTAGCTGSAAEFRAMYTHLEWAAHAYGNSWLRVLYIEVDTNMVSKSGCTGTVVVGCGDNLRPADGDYDLLGPDLYNYYFWNNNAPWRQPSYDTKLGTSSTDGLIHLAINHQKHIVIPEMGTHPGCPGAGTATSGAEAGMCPTDGSGTGTKNTWFQDLANKMTSNTDYQTWIEGFIYYHHIATHDWEFTNRESSSNTEGASPACDLAPSPALAPGVKATCWNGSRNSTSTGHTDEDTDGWHASFVVDTAAYNNNSSSWFVGGTSSPYSPATFAF